MFINLFNSNIVHSSIVEFQNFGYYVNRSKIEYESSESEDSDVGDYDSYDDKLDDSSVARRWTKKMLK